MNKKIMIVSSKVPIIEVLMITNQSYWLLMVNIMLSNRFKLIKHQMKTYSKVNMTIMYLIKFLEVEFIQIKERRFQI